MATVLKQNAFQCRVSSVSNRDVKQFGKSGLFDEKEDTCWTSDQGSPQWIALSFDNEHLISGFVIQFQGGFVGSECYLEAEFPESGIQKVESFYPDDINSSQTFQLTKAITAKRIKFVFNKSTDFFGRIIVYKLDVLGS